MKRVLVFLALLLNAAIVHAVQVTDDRGVTVSLPAPPQRVVSLLPSLTETVCGLGQCQRLVGVDRYSSYPASVNQLPRLGGGMDPNIEAVVALKPDLVLMASASRAAERLEALGIKVVALETKTYADVRRVLDKVGAVLGVDTAQQVWQQTEAGVAAAAQSLPPRARRLRVYFEVARGGYAAGESSFIGETLTRLGVQNIVPAGLGPFPKLNPEYIVRANPDLILVSERNFAGMLQRPGWGGIRAVRGQRICVISDAQSDVAVRPGPRIAEAARIMARCIADKGLEDVKK